MARKSRYVSSANAVESAQLRYIVAVYLRLSVEDGDSLESNSISNQRKLCLAFLEQHSDLDLGAVYVDDGYTGMNYKRPGFQSMLSDLRAGKVNCIIVKDVSRLGRHYVMTSEYVEKLFPEMGVRFICINDDYDSENSYSDRESLLMPFKLVMNDTYVKDTARRIRSSIHAKMDSGEFLPPVGSVPYGYLRSPEKGTFEVDTEAAPVVQRIYEMRAKGMMFNSIAKALNLEGIPSPGKLRYERGVNKSEKFCNALWIRGTIRKILSDDVYIGNRIHGKVGRDWLGGDKKRRPRENWQIIPNAHPEIITQELFEQVQIVNQAELERRAAFADRGDPSLDYREIFRGKVVCGDCGAKMTSGIVFNRGEEPVSINYDCNRYRDSNHQKCSRHYIRQEVLMATLKHFLDKQVEIAIDVEQLILEARKKADSPDGLKSQMASLRVQRLHLEAKLEQLLEDVTLGLLDPAEYAQIKSRYQKERTFIENQEERTRQEYEGLKLAAGTAETWLADIRRYQAMPRIDRGIVDALIERIVVYENRDIRICLTYGDPFAKLKALLDGTGKANRGGKHV